MEYKAAQSELELDEAAAPNPYPPPASLLSFPDMGYGAPVSCSAPGLIPQGTLHPCTLLELSPSHPQPSPALLSQLHNTDHLPFHTHPPPPSLMVHWKTINITNQRICSEPYTDSHLYICHLLQDTRNKASSTAKTF